MQAYVGTIVCKFGGDPVMFVVEEAICAKKFTDGQTPRDCISSWNELIIIKRIIIILTLIIIIITQSKRHLQSLLAYNIFEPAALC